LVIFIAASTLIGCEGPADRADQTMKKENQAKADSNLDRGDGQTNDGQTNDAPTNDGDAKVLRHAVFFDYKEGTSVEDLKKITTAFADLQNKIPAIIDFQWGENNSPENLDDGFEHCFLLTFQDESGRDEYLPHADHKAFGGILRPHLDGVFVIDYWGKTTNKKLDKRLKHAVFFKFKEDATADQIQEVEQVFAALPEKISSIKDFEWGLNNSPESHDAGFTHCFMVTFDSEEGRKEYLPHPDHKAFVEVLKPVLDKVRVLDFWANR
jgi:hypothetical protein